MMVDQDKLKQWNAMELPEPPFDDYQIGKFKKSFDGDMITLSITYIPKDDEPNASTVFVLNEEKKNKEK